MTEIYLTSLANFIENCGMDVSQILEFIERITELTQYELISSIGWDEHVSSFTGNIPKHEVLDLRISQLISIKEYIELKLEQEKLAKQNTAPNGN